jgi:hypothetical protein
MTKQYYYECPIKAAYMAEYFNVIVYIDKYGDSHEVRSCSNHIFEPKNGDMDDSGAIYNAEEKLWQDLGHAYTHTYLKSQTAFRDGKHFFTPESEEV